MEDFKAQHRGSNPLFLCNCILNYDYNDLVGKDVENLVGPVTFGEIACHLLNQTCVSLTIEEAEK